MPLSPFHGPRGRLIIIEGADGTGKTTQLSILADRLQNAGYDVASYDFPSKEGLPIGELIGSFLRGRYGSVTPEFLSLAFSIDRLTMKEAILADLAAGRFVLCDRYVSSNIAFQSAKLEDLARRQELDHLLRWLEYDIFGLPRPDLEIAMVARESYFKEGRHLARSVDPRRAYSEGEADIHESETGLQVAVNDYYCGLSAEPGVRLLNIDPDGSRIDIERVSDIIWGLLLREGVHDAPSGQFAENSHVD
jgi:dTMP kinase